MSEYQPLSTFAELALLDSDECISGYWSGRNNEPEPGSDKSKSFWHGWRNGMMDFGHMKPDLASGNLAREYVAMQRAH